MAITYGAKLFESESTNYAVLNNIGASVPAGGLICIAVAGKRSGSSLNIATVADTKGNTWDWTMYASTYRAVGVAWCRTPVAMNTSDKIMVQWNGTPTYSWKSAHSFLGASGTRTDVSYGAGIGSTASRVLGVSGSDWLTFAAIMLPDEYGVTATPLNSMTSRDDNGHASSSPWAECFSRNGTVGTTHTVGASFVASVPYAIAGVSFPAEALSSPAVTRAAPFLVGV